MPGLLALVSRMMRKPRRHVLQSDAASPQLDASPRSAVAPEDIKGAFLANMRHEILTPMNAMLGMADVLWESELSREQRECVAVIRRAGGSLSALLNDLLDLSAIEAG